jgi:hypothetical protein
MKGRFKKHQHPPFQKSATMVAWGIELPMEPSWPNFRKSFHPGEKGGLLIFFPFLYGGLYGQNLPYKFKKPYGDFQNRNFEKSHRTTDPRSDLRPDS